MKAALSVAILACSIVSVSAPARATLQIAIQAGASSFFCADNTACDTNPTLGILAVGDQTIGGLQINGSIQTSKRGSFDFLNTSSLSLINASGGSILAAFAIGDTDYTAPISSVSLSTSGTYQTAAGSSITTGWYADAANAQGADSVSDLPGTLLDAFSFSSTHITDAFAYSNTVAFSAGSPFSMTETAFGTLVKGGSLINRGQAAIAAVVPEPATWAMLLAGFAGLGFAGYRRARKTAIG